MRMLSELIEWQHPEDGFPCRGHNGYGGEQDGTTVQLSGIHYFRSRAVADAEFPKGVPEYVRLHWGNYTPGRGWEVVFGWWSNQPDKGDGNRLCGD